MTLLTSSHAPGVYYEHFDQAAPAIEGGRTDVAGFVGVAERGPVGEPVRIRSWRQFLARFGGVLPFGYLALTVRGFFANGGEECWVVRAAAAPHVTTSVAAGDGVVSIVPAPGFVPGAVLWAAATAADVAAVNTVASVDAAAGRLTWDVPLPASLWLDAPIIVEVIEPAGPGRTFSATAGAQPDDRASSIVGTTAGFRVGAAVRIIQRGRRRMTGHRIVAARGLLRELTPPLAGVASGSTVEIHTGATSATASLLDVRGRPALRVAAASPGSWGNLLEVRAVVTAGAATRALAGASEPARATRVADVSGFTRGDLVVLRPAPRPWERVYALVAGVDAEQSRLVWEPADARRRPVWARPLPDGLDAAAGFSVTRVDLGLSVQGPGGEAVMYSRLSLLPEHPRFVERALPLSPPNAWRDQLERSATVAGEQNRVAASQAALIVAQPIEPFDGDADRLAVLPGVVNLLGGGDGLVALSPRDLIGAPAREGAEIGTGLGALDGVDPVAIVAVPDAHVRPAPRPETLPSEPPDSCPCPPADPPPAARPLLTEDPPEMTEAEIGEIHAALVAQCEARRDRVALIEAPHRPEDPAEEGIARARRWRRRFDTSFAALYHPWLEVLDPSRPGATRSIPPGGYVAGICARADLAVGVHRAPAGYPLEAVHTATARLDEARHGLLNGESVNCILAYPGRGIRVMGARTLSSDPAYRYLSTRRLLSAIEEAVDEGLQWAVFESADHQLRELVRLGIGGLLEGYWRAGALRGDEAAEAFYVRCDDENNPPDAVDRGELVADVGVAIAAPAEFVVFRVGRTANELRITESPSGLGVGS